MSWLSFIKKLEISNPLSFERRREKMIAKHEKKVQVEKRLTSSVGEFIIPGYKPLHAKSRRINGIYTE